MGRWHGREGRTLSCPWSWKVVGNSSSLRRSYLWPCAFKRSPQIQPGGGPKTPKPAPECSTREARARPIELCSTPHDRHSCIASSLHLRLHALAPTVWGFLAL